MLALRDSRGNTPLHLTAINNHTDAAQYLVSFKINFMHTSLRNSSLEQSKRAVAILINRKRIIVIENRSQRKLKNIEYSKY